MTKFNSIEEYTESQTLENQSIIDRIRKVIFLSHPKMQEKFDHNVIVFIVKNPVCYIVSLKGNQGIEVGFHRGKDLSNEQGILDAKNRKYISGITIQNLQDLDMKEQKFKEIMQEAILLDEFYEKSVFTEILQKGKSNRI